MMQALDASHRIGKTILSPTVLVLGEDERIARLTRNSLVDLGIASVHFINLRFPRSAAPRSEDTDIVLIDLPSSGSDGLRDWLNALRASIPNIPLVAMAGAAQIGARRLSLECFDVVLRKPFTQEDLIEALLCLTTPESH